MRNGLIGLVLLLAAGFVASPAAADWLVLTDGSKVETDGPWEVKGRLIVFTAASGKLASLRASNVDLEASHRATTEAHEAEEAARLESAMPPPEPPPKAPILVLTDADVSHVADEDLEEEGAEEEVEDPSGLRVVVANWDQEEAPDGNGVSVTGTLRNDGNNVATSIQLQVQIVNSEGVITGTAQAELTSNSLGSGEVLNFRANFPDQVGFDTARFDISGREFLPAPRVTPADEEALLDRDRDPEPAVEDPF